MGQLHRTPPIGCIDSVLLSIKALFPRPSHHRNPNLFAIIPSLRYSEQVVYARRGGRYHETSGKLASRRSHRHGASAALVSTGATPDRAAPSGARTQKSH